MSELNHTIMQPELRPLLETVVSLIDWPSAIIADGEHVLVSNEQWQHITHCPNEPDMPQSIMRSLQDFSQVGELVAKLQGSPQVAGSRTTRRKAVDSSSGEGHEEYELRWRQFKIPSQHNSLAIVSLHEKSDDTHPAQDLGFQQSRIERLLIRQTLIEESERERIGRALHDVVVQDLAQIRAAIRSSQLPSTDVTEKIIESVDRIIDEVRTLTFDLGPPILEDLGLRPALDWLAEHLRDRYDADITLADDECNPHLSKAVRTIVFRAVRELAINAAKHAPDAEIVISCVTNHKSVRIIVCDTGPGFDTTAVRSAKDGNNYGLLSVEQQIRGIDGTFDIISEIGEGTRATITVPTEQEDR